MISLQHDYWNRGEEKTCLSPCVNAKSGERRGKTAIDRPVGVGEEMRKSGKKVEVWRVILCWLLYCGLYQIGL